VSVSNNKITFLEDIVLTSDITMIGVIDIVYYADLISADEPQKMAIPSKTIIQSGGSKGAAAIVSRFITDAQIVDNQMVIRGSRPGSSTVYIDGMRVTDEMSSLPSLGIGSVEVYTGGIPSRYGDVTGGVVMMTMKGYFDILSERRAMESIE
jgi:outer membrane receptor protein involved in Fe transport